MKGRSLSTSLIKFVNFYAKQLFKLSSVTSIRINVTPDVLQGSHLGPLLFISFIINNPDIYNTSNC